MLLGILTVVNSIGTYDPGGGQRLPWGMSALLLTVILFVDYQLGEINTCGKLCGKTGYERSQLRFQKLCKDKAQM